MLGILGLLVPMIVAIRKGEILVARRITDRESELTGIDPRFDQRVTASTVAVFE